MPVEGTATGTNHILLHQNTAGMAGHLVTEQSLCAVASLPRRLLQETMQYAARSDPPATGS